MRGPSLSYAHELRVLDPATEAVVTTVPAASADDVGSPHARIPEVAAARSLFPSAFGLPSSEPNSAQEGLFSYSTSLFEGLPMPPAECLNSVTQPSIAAWQLHRLKRIHSAPERARLRRR